MTADNFLDPTHFRRVLARNVTLPLVLGLLGAALFVGVIYYLLDSMKWVEHSAEVMAEGREVAQISAEMESGMRGFLNTGSDATLEQFTGGAARFNREMATVQQLTGDNPVQQARLRTITELQAQWITHANELIQKRREGVDLKEILAIGKARVAREQIRAEFERFFAEEQRLSRQRSETANTAVPVLGGFYLFITLAIGAILAWVGRRELMKLSATYGDAMERQAADNRRLEDQAWLRTGQSGLADAVLGKQALNVLGRNILEFMAKYIDSHVGALYVRGADGTLTRAAAYGFAPDALRAEQAFHPAESLVSEAAARGSAIRLDGPPAGYLRVNSGLGEASPASVVLVPIQDDGFVNGVIELGFMRPVQQRDLDLLTMVAPNVGSLVEAAHYRRRLQDTLEETQQLNEELQVQQEELRTANEELEEQSRALKESQAHLESQQAELEQTNVQLAEQRDALDLKNEALNEAQGELERRAADLQRASQYKSEFLANMSHELRTPLNSSLILAKLLADNGPGNLSAEQIKFAESIYSAGNDLLNLINDILDIAKVEAGKLDVRAEVTSVASLSEALKRTFEPLASTKKLAFELKLAPGLPPTLFTDRQRVEQILKNLLSNAIKFTDKGAVTLSVSRRGADQLAFEVQDSGIGIAADQQQIIFEAFRQADGTTSRRYGGTGLGLSISRDLAGLLGGAIEVDSKPGKGSRFTLVLPLDYQPSQAAAPAALVPPPAPAASQPPAASRAPRAASFPDDRDREPAPQQRRVLVVEDEPQFARILFDLAHELGYSCLVSHHADEAWELAGRFLPDAVLLDMRLPDDSGLSVLQKLKDSPRTRHIPVHVISVEDLSEAALQMGAIGYARKPTSREELRAVFARLEAKLAQKVKRVLVVEDDALQRESIARLIGDDDIEITAVELGEKALALLRTTVFDCMVIDLKLPDMQGNELLKRMAAEDIRSFPPVIVYTGRNLTRDEEADLLRYSRSIIIKGARSPERLLDEVTLFLHKVETDLSSERQKMLKVARNRDKLFEGRRILIVDDDVRNIFALTSALEHKGASVVVGRNGREALDKLEATPDIDLVLMDIMMPEMDGYTATREIRKNPRFNKLPIIAVTAKAMRDDQERCLAAGANDYLAKPIELERLFSLIRVWMPKLERI